MASRFSPRSSQFDDQIVSLARRFVPEHDAGRVVVHDDEVKVAISVEIAAGQAATHVEFIEVGTGPAVTLANRPSPRFRQRMGGLS